MLDAVVAGLGPAGSTAARALASKGLKVLAIDKERFPRYKPCGGCISTKVERILDFPISDVIEETVLGATFTYKSGRAFDILSDKPVGHNVMRDKFDNFLVNKAKEAGAEALEGVRVKGIAQDSRSVTVFCDNGQSYKARFLVGADGSSGLVGREYFGFNPKEAAVSVTAEVPYDRADRDFKGRLFIDFGGVP
ncbi:MAG: FAD-dependent monooxygenase, partial [Deltaproteobacteria bacterium]|nr:FAD-dependent monooxygenase [Deltaproteobacteria bacterium]